MAVALGTNIANPISTALSQWLGFDTMGKLENYGKLGAASDPDAVITALFANSEQGAWYDPSDLTTLFQDRAGTTPVTADGQTVGKILDKSGRGNHAVAPNDSARPLYKTSGGLHWLQFDGVDDSLATAAIDFTSTATDKMSVFGGVHRLSDAYGCIVESSTNVLSTQGCFGVLGGGWYSAGAKYGSAISGTSGAFSFDTIAAYAAPITSVLCCLYDLNGAVASDELKFRINGSVISGTTSGITSGLTGNFTSQNLYIGARGSASLPLNGRIYSAIVLGRLATTQEITDTETWVNGKTGAY